MAEGRRDGAPRGVIVPAKMLGEVSCQAQAMPALRGHAGADGLADDRFGG